MRFLLDQNVYALTVTLLSQWGHDIVLAKEIGLAEAADPELLASANANGRILVTRDRDFGQLVFNQKLKGGVIYLRIPSCTENSVHDELRKVLLLYHEAELEKAFVVVEPGGHRFRRIAD
ncbi:MAG: DUF5615 family PIN-like protein [Candidatus Hydrogenedentes bacterium]|nr:DUF5615 family PIN-like protein [Candidatus Hydrogenedentota bacterium]